MEMFLKNSVYIYINIYVYYIHPELRIGDCCFGSGKAAGPEQVPAKTHFCTSVPGDIYKLPRFTTTPRTEHMYI